MTDLLSFVSLIALPLLSLPGEGLIGPPINPNGQLPVDLVDGWRGCWFYSMATSDCGGLPSLVPGRLCPGKAFPLYIPLAGCWRLADRLTAAPAGCHHGEARALAQHHRCRPQVDVVGLGPEQGMVGLGVRVRVQGGGGQAPGIGWKPQRSWWWSPGPLLPGGYSGRSRSRPAPRLLGLQQRPSPCRP